jgi:hypothetical protein
MATFGLACGTLACSAPRETPPPAARPQAEGPGVREMAALLEERAAKVDPMKLELLVNDRRAEVLGERLRIMPAGLARFDTQFAHAKELLHAGRSEDAVRALEELERSAAATAPEAWRANRTTVLLLKGTAFLRMAEEQNCCSNNNRDSCLLPIKGEGIHKKREGSTRAIEIFEEVLAADPGNLRARWLINIAHMTLGTYPGGLSPKALIPPRTFDSVHPLPEFPNIAREAGLSLFGLAGGSVLDDFDNDGRLDLMVSFQGLRDQMRYLRNRGDGMFEDRTEAAGLLGEVGGLNMIHADYDNDGFVDVVVLRGGWLKTEGNLPLSLLRNSGDGTFSDVTVDAGLLRFAPTQTAAFFDYDGDGWLDLFVGNESTTGNEKPCQLFHNNGDLTFTEVAEAAGVSYVGWVKGVAAGDYDNDGRPDLYLSLQGGANVLFHNDGPREPQGSWRRWRFTDTAARAGVDRTRFSFGTFFFDYDNDGWLDLLVVGYSPTQAEDIAADYLGLPTKSERSRLYRNEGDGTFQDVTRAVGLHKVILAMGHNFGDLDNDGFLDVYFGTGNPDFSLLVPNRMFRNAEGRRFQDVTTAGNFGHLQKGHGVSFGDIDNDGDQDVFEQMGGAYLADKAWSALYANPGNENAWIGLDLVGVRSNRKAVGARIKVTAATKKGVRNIHRTVGGGGSFGASPFAQHIGLGAADRIVAAEIFWPVTGKTQRVLGLSPGRWYRIREDEIGAQPLERPSFAFKAVSRLR